MKKEALFTIADQQLGYFTAVQAVESGYFRSNFHRMVRSGEWEKILRGVYRLILYPDQDREELALWSLWSRDKTGKTQGVWSHETALDIYELSDIMPAKMHMSVPKKFRRNSPIPKHIQIHKAKLTKEEVIQRRGYQITTPLRTLIDVIHENTIDQGQIELAIEQAYNRGLISVQDIHAHAAKFEAETTLILNDILAVLGGDVAHTAEAGPGVVV